MLTCGSLFTGGGGADIGLKQAGFKSLWGIERDVKIAKIAQLNFPDSVIINHGVGDINLRGLKPIDLLWMSPPCQQYSNARRGVKTDHLDRDAGLDSVRYFYNLKPRWVILENVPGYEKSVVFKQILTELGKQGYQYHHQVLNASDHGVPQSRKRLIMIASAKGEKLPWFPSPSRQVGWYKAIADLIPEMVDCELADWQVKRLKELGYLPEKSLVDIGKNCSRATTVREPNDPRFTITSDHVNSHSPILLIPRAGACIKNILPTPQNKPCPTIRAMASGRHTHWADIVAGSQVKRISQAATARLQTFPDSYQFPESKTLAQQIIGNAVPPLLAQTLAKSILKSIN